MVAIGVIECGYNYVYVELIIHQGSLIFFVTLHQEFGRLTYDGLLSVSQIIFNAHFSTKTLHVYPSFKEPNVWIMEINNCQMNLLHLSIGCQPQRCRLILTT
jgi:hypothetical protein